jgi:hypothetical protein
MKFDGWDFTELLDVLLPDFKGTEEEHLKLFKKTLFNPRDLENIDPYTTWLPIMRKWLNVFTKGDDCAMALYKGLAKIEDDWTFAKYFSILISYMWT